MKVRRAILGKGKYRIAAALAAGFFCGYADPAHATAANMITLTNNLVTGTGSAVTLLSSFSYVAGVAMVVFGVLRLKQHVDNPAATPMRQGIIRLTAGGCLLSLPFLCAIMMGSISGATGTAFTPTYLNDFGSAAVPVYCMTLPAYCGY